MKVFKLKGSQFGFSGAQKSLISILPYETPLKPADYLNLLHCFCLHILGKENVVIFIMFIRKFLIGNRSVKGFVIIFCLLQDFYIRSRILVPSSVTRFLIVAFLDCGNILCSFPPHYTILLLILLLRLSFKADYFI